MNGAKRPMTFDAANRWLASRVSVPTFMSSAEIAVSKNFRARVRAHCFFSAKVASANVLDGLRREADKFARGEIDLATARMRLKLFLAKHGHRPDDVADADSPPPGVDEAEWKEARSLANIASTARLNLILRQNARMARAVGQHEVSTSPDVRERWPLYRYVPSVSRNKREDHQKFYNLVLPKDHPFWRTHLPPSDFNCKCSVEDVAAKEAEEFGGVDEAVVTENPDGSQSARMEINGKPVNAEPSESGFVFDVESAFDVCRMDLVKSAPVRARVLASLAAFVRERDDVRFNCVPGAASAKITPVDGDPEETRRFVEEKAAELKRTGKMTPGEIKAGTFSRELREALGIEGTATVTLGTGNKSHGLEHTRKRHAAEIADGRFVKALNETLYEKGVRTTLTLTGKKVICGVANPRTGAYATLIKHGDGWADWRVVSAHYPGKRQSEMMDVQK